MIHCIDAIFNLDKILRLKKVFSLLTVCIKQGKMAGVNIIIYLNSLSIATKSRNIIWNVECDVYENECLEKYKHVMSFSDVLVESWIRVKCSVRKHSKKKQIQKTVFANVEQLW